MRVSAYLALGRGGARPAIECGGRSYSRAEVDERVDRLARRLVAAGVRPGVLVGVALAPSVEQVVTALAVMRAGGAFLLLDPALPEARVRELVDEAGVVIVLDGEGIPRVTVEPEPELLDVAAVFCTSGSTGRPKVVPLRHASIVNFIEATVERIGLTADDVVLGLANPSFDAWLLELVLPFATGATLRLCDGEERLDGVARARALVGVTVFLDTPTRLRNLLEAGWWPLHPIKVLSAGEPLLPDLVAALFARGCRVFNVYGPTEVCVCSNVGEIRSAVGPIPVGPALRGVEVWVDGEEIVIGGAGVSRGYLRRPELRAGRFVDGAYRTGDAGRIEGGVLYCLGRLDRQVKVRGQRIEPGEVEARIRRVAGVVDCVVYLVEGQLAAEVVGRVDLGVVEAELRAALPPAMVPARWLRVERLRLTGTGKVRRGADPTGGQAQTINTCFEKSGVGPSAGPKGGQAQTINTYFEETGVRPSAGPEGGQAPTIDTCPGASAEAGGAGEAAGVGRQATGRGQETSGGPDAVPPPACGAPAPRVQGGPPTHQREDADNSGLSVNRLCLTPKARGERVNADNSGLSVNRWCLTPLFDQVLGRSGTEPDDDFFLLGGHSLLAAQLALLIQRRLHRAIRIADIFQLRTPARLAAHLALAARPDPIPAIDRAHPLPQSFEQARIWTHAALNPDDPLYNLHFHLDLDGPVNPAALHAALDTLVARHEALRTTLHLDGTPVQHIHPPSAVPLAAVPPRLDTLPGLHAHLDGPRLHLRVHHAFFDAWSAHVLLDDLADCLAGTLGPAPTLQPADVAAWQRARWTPAAAAPPIDRWRQRLAGFAPTPRPPTAGSDAHVHPVRLSASAVARIRAHAQGRTVHNVLAAAWAGFLSTVLDGDGVVLATLAANRTRPELERMIGFFANTTLLPVRWLDGDLLDQVQVRATECMDDAELPFDLLVAGLRPTRGADLQPLARAFFGMAEPPRTRVVGDLRLTLREVPAPRSPFDLALELCDDGTTITGRFLARAALYSRAEADTIGAALDAWIEAGAKVRRSPRPPGETPLLRPRHAALFVPPAAPITAPGAPALRVGPPLDPPAGRLLDLLGRGHHTFYGNAGDAHEVSGADLQRRAERFAGGLHALGVANATLRLADPEDFVVAFWGCVRAGVTVAPTGFVIDAVTLDGPPPPIPPLGTVLVLATAGSTGAPKAVPHTDAEILAFCASYTAALHLQASDVFLNVLGLDHVAPLFMSHLITMWLDATEVQAPAQRWLTTPRLWLDLAHQHRATAAVAPSFAWGLVADAADGHWDLSTMRAALNGGETVSPAVARRVLDRLGPHGFSAEALRPGWGMSETCSCAVVSRVLTLDEGLVALGDPLPGFTLRIADDAGRTLGEGETGRLLVRGPTVLQAYDDGPALDDEGWFDTGDLGRIGPHGLVLTGRSRDVVVIHGQKVPLTEIEAVAGDAFACLVPTEVGEPALGLVVVGDSARMQAAADAVAQRFGARPRWLAAVRAEEVPRGTGGKVDRRQLGALVSGAAEDRLPVAGTRTIWLDAPMPTGRATVVDARGWTLADVVLPPGDVVLRVAGVERVYPEDELDPVQSAIVGAAMCLAREQGQRLTVVDGGVDEGVSAPIVVVRDGRRLVPSAAPVDLETGARRMAPAPGWLLIGGHGGVGSRLARWIEGPVSCVGRGDPLPDGPVGTVVLLVPGDDVDVAIERARNVAANAARWGARLLSVGSVLGSAGAAGFGTYVACDRAVAAVVTAAGGLHVRTPAWRDTGLRRGYHGPDALDPDAAALALIAAIERVLPPDTLVVPPLPVATRAPEVPATRSEAEVARVFADVLGVDGVDPTRGFFELGGTSLLLAGLQARLAERFGRTLSLVELFQHATPRSMAAFLDGAVATSDATDRAAQQRAAFARAAARRRG